MRVIKLHEYAPPEHPEAGEHVGYGCDIAQTIFGLMEVNKQEIVKTINEEKESILTKV
jgi:hypothetical protein